MNERRSKIIDNDDCHLRCVECKKVLAKRFAGGDFEIKCHHCKTINVVSWQGITKKA